LTGVAGANIRRGDTVKLVDGKLFPALSNEKHIGAAAEAIREGAEMICSKESHWRNAPSKSL
jgi:hypothetical protein